MSHPCPNRAADHAAAARLPALRPLTLAIHMIMLSGAFALASWSPSTMAQSTAAAPGARNYDIPAGTLSGVLTRFSREAGVFLVGAGNTAEGKTSPGLKGSYTVQAGFAALLVGTGLEAFRQSDGSYGLRQTAAAPAPLGAQSEPTLPVIRVTANSESLPGELPKNYAGGQVARGGRVGLLGNRNVFDTPFSVTHVTAQHIEATQANSLGDVVAADPSVRSMAPRGTHYDQLAIRGFHLFNAEFMFDGLYAILPDQSYPVEFAERVEIFKGANSFLNGVSLSGNIAGAVNVVPKRATEAPITRATVSYASQSLFGTHVDMGRRFGEQKEWGVRGNVVVKDGNSVVADQGHRREAAQLSADYRNEKVRATFDVGYQNQRDDRTFSFVNVAGTLPSVPRAPRGDQNFQPSWTYVKNENLFGLARAEFDASEQITLFAAIGGANNNYEALVGSPAVNASSGGFSESPSFYRVEQHNLSSEFGARVKLLTGTIRHELVATGNYVNQDSRIPVFYSMSAFTGNLYQANATPAPVIGGTNNGSTSKTTLSSVAVGDTIFALQDSLQLTLGARHQRIEGSSFSLAGVQTADYNKARVTPFISIVFKPIERLSLYANYIEGFTRGPVAPAGTVNAGQVFDPIQSKSKEIGAKYDFGQFGMGLSIFELTQPQAITTSVSPGVSRYGLDGEQRNRGIEYSVFGEAARGLRVLGGVTLLDAKLLKTAGGVNDGKRGVGAPGVSANLGLDADVPGVAGLAINGRVLYTSAQYVTANNALEIPAWTRFDLGARYVFNWGSTPLTARFNVENLADKAYWATATRGFLSRGAPRTFLASLTVDF